MRGISDDAVGENLDASDVEIGNVLVKLARFLDGGKFGRGIFGEHLRERVDLGIQFTVIGEKFVGSQNIVAGQGIEPCGNAEAVVVLQSGAGSGEQFVGRERGDKGFDLFGAGINEEAVGLAAFVFICIYAVIGALGGRKFLEEIGGDAGALQESTIGPGGMAIHAAEENTLIRVGSGAEVSVEDVGVRPELEREPEDLEDIAAHAFAGFLGGSGEGWEFGEGEYFLAGVGCDEAESAFDRVAVRIDEAGEQSFAVEIDALGGCGDGLLDFGKVADGDDFVSVKSDRFRVRILRIGGEDFGVEEDPVSGGVLRPKRAGSENECRDKEKEYRTARELSQRLPFPMKV